MTQPAPGSPPQALLTLSMKGGVGKTTTAIGLARALQRRGEKVGLLDVDIHGSALPRALHLEQPPGYEPLLGGQLRPIAYDGFQLFSIGLLFSEDEPTLWDGEQKRSAVQQLATSAIAWGGDVRWVVVDTPPTSGDEVQSLMEHLPCIYGSVIVTQPNDLSLLGITKTLNMLREAHSPICGLLVNMASYTCPHCGQLSNPFDREAVDIERLAEEFGVPYLGQVPFAGEEERALVLDQVLERILARQPVYLQQRKREGGIVGWMLKALKT